MHKYIVIYQEMYGELEIEAPSLKEAFEQFKTEHPSLRIVDIRGEDVLMCGDCEYKDSASCFETVTGTICPKCGSPHVRGTT